MEQPPHELAALRTGAGLKSRPRTHPWAWGVTAILVVLVSTVPPICWLHREARQAQMDGIRTELCRLAQLGATSVDGDLHKRLTGPEQMGSPEHLAAVEPLIRFHSAIPDLFYVYSLLYKEESFFFVLDTAVAPERLPPIKAERKVSGIMERYDHSSPEDAAMLAAVKNGQPFAYQELVQDDYGVFMTAHAPIHDSEGALVGFVGVDLEVGDLAERLHRLDHAAQVAIFTASAIAFACGVGVTLFSRQRRKAEVAILSAREEAEAANRAKSTFLAIMSHEIRTPLNGVLGMCKILLDGPLNREQSRVAGVIHSSAEALLVILNDILDFSKIEAGKLQLEHVPFDLRTLAQDVVELFGERASEKGIMLRLSWDKHVPRTYCGDPARLRQVLLNLCSNAIKFTDRGEVAVAVRLEGATPDAAQVRIEVSDTGIGIDGEALDRLFKPFEQADSSTTRRYGGTGLGLAICRSLIERMGGRITAESRPGSGSVFRINLELERFTGELPKAGERDPEPEAFAHQLTVLVAEDVLTNQEIAHYELTRLGHEVHIVADGRAALQVLKTQRFDAILMDGHMPELDGIQATQAIRRGDSGVLDKDVFIIAMTANASAEDRARYLAAGMNEYLAKPPSRAKLAAALRKAEAFQQARGVALRPMPSEELSDAQIDAVFDKTRAGQRATNSPLPSSAKPASAKRVLEIALAELPAKVEALQAALVRQDRAEAARLAHGVAGSTGYLGHDRLTSLCKTIENWGKHGPDSPDHGWNSELAVQFSDLKQQIVSKLEQTGLNPPPSTKP